MSTGQMNLEIPPGQQSYTVVGKCHSECSRKLIQDPINIFWATNHMHYLGNTIIRKSVLKYALCFSFQQRCQFAIQNLRDKFGYAKSKLL